VRLLTRTPRRQSLTEFGRAYYERCRAVLAEVDAADALAADQLAEPRGRLRVTMPVLFGRRCVAPILLDLARQHPALELELSFSDPLSDLAESGCDLAVRTGDLQDMSGVITRRLARQRMIVCAAPSYLAAQGTPERVAELQQHQAIIYGRTGRTAPWRFPRPDGPEQQIVPPSRLRLDDLEAIADAAAAGLGLAWLPSWLVRERLAAGTLVRLLPDETEFPYDSHALWLQTPQLPRKVRLAVDTLAAALPKLMA